MSNEPTTTDHSLVPLSEAECWQLLGKSGIGRLAVVVGHQPDIFPVNYLLDGTTIVIRSAEGTKLAAALMGQLVAFEIDGFNPAHHSGWSVVVHGTATEDRSLSGTMRDEQLGLEPWADGIKSRYIHVEANTITGRYLPPLAEPVQQAQP